MGSFTLSPWFGAFPLAILLVILVLAAKGLLQLSNDTATASTSSTSGPSERSELDRLSEIHDILMNADDKIFRSRRPNLVVLSDEAFNLSLEASRLVIDAAMKLEERIRALGANR